MTPAYATALLAALRKESGGELISSSPISTLSQLASGTTQASVKHLGVVTTLAREFLGREVHRLERHRQMGLLKVKCASLKGAGKEEFYRLTKVGEANAITGGARFAQGENSMDKYKWFYQDSRNHPLEGGGRTHRLTMEVSRGTIQAILDMAVPHEGSALQAPIVSRDRAMFEARRTNRIDASILSAMTNEPGSFAVHEDALAEFSSLIVKRTASTI